MSFIRSVRKQNTRMLPFNVVFIRLSQDRDWKKSIFRPKDNMPFLFFLGFYFLMVYGNYQNLCMENSSTEQMWLLTHHFMQYNFLLASWISSLLWKRVTHNSLINVLRLPSKTLYRRALEFPHLFACVIFLFWFKICIIIIHITNIYQKHLEGLSFVKYATCRKKKEAAFQPVKHGSKK